MGHTDMPFVGRISLHAGAVACDHLRVAFDPGGLRPSTPSASTGLKIIPCVRAVVRPRRPRSISAPAIALTARRAYALP